jgi:hypothetical protein
MNITAASWLCLTALCIALVGCSQEPSDEPSAADRAEAAQSGLVFQSTPLKFTKSDAFYPYYMAGLSAGGTRIVTSKPFGQEGGYPYGLALHDYAKRFLLPEHVSHKPARVQSELWGWQTSGPYTLRGKFTGPSWREKRSWCWRLAFKPGEEADFAYILYHLSKMENAELWLPKFKKSDQPVTPAHALTLIDPQPLNGLLLPVTTILKGKSASEITDREWHISEPSESACQREPQNR